MSQKDKDNEDYAWQQFRQQPQHDGWQRTTRPRTEDYDRWSEASDDGWKWKNYKSWDHDDSNGWSSKSGDNGWSSKSGDVDRSMKRWLDDSKDWSHMWTKL